MDYDGDGNISWDEFKASWMALFDGWSYRELEKVFRFADENNDGILSKDECRGEKSAQDSFNHKFSAVDQDHDSALTLHEWESNLLWIPKNSTPAVVRERFGYYDENSDGMIQRFELYNVIRAN